MKINKHTYSNGSISSYVDIERDYIWTTKKLSTGAVVKEGRRKSRDRFVVDSNKDRSCLSIEHHSFDKDGSADYLPSKPPRTGFIMNKEEAKAIITLMQEIVSEMK